MTGEFRQTVYGPIAIDHTSGRLADLCEPGAGAQTGLFGVIYTRKTTSPSLPLYLQSNTLGKIVSFTIDPVCYRRRP